MGPDSREKYLELVGRRIQLGQENLASLEQARNSSDSRATSRYDTQREIFNGDANVQRVLLEKLKQFQAVVEQALPTNRIEPGAEFSIELWDEDDEINGVIYSPVSVAISGITIITPESPIGAAIEGMIAGNTFVYSINNRLMAGIIKDIQ